MKHIVSTIYCRYKLLITTIAERKKIQYDNPFDRLSITWYLLKDVNEIWCKELSNANIIMEQKVGVVKNLLCMACLCVERTLHELSDGNFKQYYLNCLNEIPLYIMPRVLSICWECEAMLKKAVHFREQVKDSYRILQTYTSENLAECLLTDVSRPPRLKVHVNQPINFSPGEGIAKESRRTDKDSDCIKVEPKNEDIHTEKGAENGRGRKEPASGGALEHVIEERQENIKAETILSHRNPNNFNTVDQHASDAEVRLKELNVVDIKEEQKAEFGNNNPGNVASEGGCPTSDRADLELETELQKFIEVKKNRRKNKGNVKSVSKRGKKTVKKEPSRNPATEDQNTSNGDVTRSRQLGAVDVKEELNVEFGKKYERGSELETDHFTSGCSDLELETELQKFIGAKKSKKKTRGSVKSVARRVKKTVKKVRKADESAREKVAKKILTVKLSYDEMMLERQRESGRDAYKRAAYKCERCLVGFNTNKAYESHVGSKHSPDLGKHSCPICGTVVSTVESFTEHCKRHFRRYECTICLKRTMDKKTIEQHYFSTHEITLKEYRCNLCGKVSNSVDSHRYHRDTHKARVQCPDCEKTFSHRAGLMNHRLAVHELQNTFPCTLCDKVFRWRTSLKRHLEKHDTKSSGSTGAGVAFCATCGIEFSSLCSYRRHLRNSLKHVTRDQLKFICDHCNKRFADKTKLRDHIEEKHLHRVYQCQICNKATKNRVGLDQHIRYVHRGRPNSKMCHYCGKGFPTKVQLESHIRTHTGERPFICEYCPTTFSQKSNLYKHNRQVHLNIKTKRHPLCKKRREEKRTAEVVAPQAPVENKQPDNRTPGYPEQLFGTKLRTPEFIVGW